MALALYDVLRGEYSDGQAVVSPPTDADLLRSIRDHLNRLLNARQGVLSHLPDYGLPDPNEFYQDLPYSERDLTMAVKSVIERFEPRIKHVRVQVSQNQSRNQVISLDISGRINNGMVRITTDFLSGGNAQVNSPVVIGGRR